MSNTEAEELRVHARHLRERARGVMDNNRRREMMEEACDVDLLADDIEEKEREKAEDEQ